MGSFMKEEDLKNKAILLRELGSSYGETAVTMSAAMKGFTEELRFAQRLSKRNNGNSRLIQIGLALIAFPDPTISDVLGAAFIAAGLVQNKIRRSSLQLEDVYKTFPELVKELHSIRKGLVEQ